MHGLTASIAVSASTDRTEAVAAMCGGGVGPLQPNQDWLQGCLRSW